MKRALTCLLASSVKANTIVPFRAFSKPGRNYKFNAEDMETEL
jgi:hypothetical protein